MNNGINIAAIDGAQMINLDSVDVSSLSNETLAAIEVDADRFAAALEDVLENPTPVDSNMIDVITKEIVMETQNGKINTPNQSVETNVVEVAEDGPTTESIGAQIEEVKAAAERVEKLKTKVEELSDSEISEEVEESVVEKVVTEEVDDIEQRAEEIVQDLADDIVERAIASFDKLNMPDAVKAQLKDTNVTVVPDTLYAILECELKVGGQVDYFRDLLAKKVAAQYANNMTELIKEHTGINLKLE